MLNDTSSFPLEELEAFAYVTFITLSVPKFKIKNEIDFIPLLEKLGLEKIFDKDYSTLNNPFIIKKGYKY